MRTGISALALTLGSLMFVPWTVRAADAPAVIAEHAAGTLSRFVRTVVDANPRVKAARAALEARGALRDAASRPLYNPELNLAAENADTDTRAVAISQSIDWAGKRRARTAVAEADRLVAEAEYRFARWSVTVELLQGLAFHQTGVARDALAATRRGLMDDFAALAERRFNAGDLNQVELDLARLSATDARIRKATAAADLAEARQAVRNLIAGTTVGEWPVLPLSMPGLPEDVDPQLLVLALPEVVAARRQVETADALVELRRRERRPDPTLSLSGGDESGTRLVGLSVSMPLYIRNGFKYEVNAALADLTQAQRIADDVMQRAYSRLQGAAERYELSRGAWDEWQTTGRVSLTRQTQQLQRLWQSGELSTTEYLVQLTATLDVQESALDLREALWRAWFEWLWASGQVDVWLGIAR